MIKKYQLGTYLDEIYSSFPEAQQRPMIGITFTIVKSLKRVAHLLSFRLWPTIK